MIEWLPISWRPDHYMQTGNLWMVVTYYLFLAWLAYRLIRKTLASRERIVSRGIKNAALWSVLFFPIYAFISPIQLASFYIFAWQYIFEEFEKPFPTPQTYTVATEQTPSEQFLCNGACVEHIRQGRLKAVRFELGIFEVGK